MNTRLAQARLARLIVCVLLTISGIAAPSLADEESRYGAHFAPIDREEVALLFEVCAFDDAALDDVERAVAIDLFDGMHAEFQERLKPLWAEEERVRVETERLRALYLAWEEDQADSQSAVPMPKDLYSDPYEHLRALEAELRASSELARFVFLNDLHDLIGAEREQTWLRYERALARRALCQRIKFELPSVDVYDVLRATELSEDSTTALKAVVERWEREAVALVVPMQKTLERIPELFAAHGLRYGPEQEQQLPESDRREVGRLRMAFFERYVRLSRLNRGIADNIEQRLQGAERFRFARAFQRDAYWSVAAETHGEAMLVRALTCVEDLNGDQRQSVEQLKTRIEQQLFTLRRTKIKEREASLLASTQVTAHPSESSYWLYNSIDRLYMGGFPHFMTIPGSDVQVILDQIHTQLSVILTAEQATAIDLDSAKGHRATQNAQDVRNAEAHRAQLKRKLAETE